jgi:hypothetical protein
VFSCEIVSEESPKRARAAQYPKSEAEVFHLKRMISLERKQKNIPGKMGELSSCLTTTIVSA